MIHSKLIGTGDYTLFMQKDWGQSKGARVEYAIARELGLQIYHEGSF